MGGQHPLALRRHVEPWFIGGTPEELPDRYRQVSPRVQLQTNLMPTLLVTGHRDACAPHRQVERFSGALAAYGVDTQVEVLPFAVHAFDDAYGSIAAQTSRRILLNFLTGTDDLAPTSP